jgi:3-phenylpropionate/trans-cinnamate dioxygenase ferredoxin component
MPELDVCPVEELPPGEMKIVTSGLDAIGVYNIGGAYYALEDRCSHDDGPLCEGEFDPETGVVVCPRHGANFDIRSGDALTLPATEPVSTYPVRVVDGMIRVLLGTVP